jgi:hypothetical protein
MASWRKYFTTVPSQAQLTNRLDRANRENSNPGTTHKLGSYLPEVYAGAPNRIERYVQYDQADLDSEINRALDTIAEFCTQNQDEDDPVPFRLIYRGDLTETEMKLLTSSLQQWSSINRFEQRVFRMFRNTIKYGDQFFIRDPETFELLWVDASKVEKIIVNEAEGKAVEQYVMRDLDFNLQSLTATNPLVQDNYSFPGGYPRSSNPAAGAGNINYGQPTTPGGRTSRFYNPANSLTVDAAHVVHISLSEGMDQYWPFGISIIEAVYKTYKQKDLLEDCILIYRIVRAPERRVFYIDVGQLQGQRAMAYVERVKNEIYQRRMPNRNGSGSSTIDTSYNPISITEDFFLATNSEQRGTRIDTLAAGENLGCFSMDTKIRLLDGRDLSIADVGTLLKQGQQLWTYSCHPTTGEIAPGKITWAGRTRKDAQVLRITLDSGDVITCTPDHKFPLRGVGFVEAKDLPVGQNLITLHQTSDRFVTSIKYLDEVMDVGTLTVDGDHLLHDWHTYALSVGVFVKNSIDDLRYFSNKLMRGLGIPSSYLPTGPEDGTALYNDGKVGTAFIQEYRFNKYCQRLQSAVIPTLDREFKLFLKNRGIDIAANLFQLAFNPPQSFSDYRKLSLDTERVNLFNSAMSGDAVKYLSKRWAMGRYLGLTQEDILENESQWKEENAAKVKKKTGVSPMDAQQVSMNAVGIQPPMEPEFGEPMGDTGGELPPPEPGGAGEPSPDLGGTPTPPAGGPAT